MSSVGEMPELCSERPVLQNPFSFPKWTLQDVELRIHNASDRCWEIAATFREKEENLPSALWSDFSSDRQDQPHGGTESSVATLWGPSHCLGGFSARNKDKHLISSSERSESKTHCFSKTYAQRFCDKTFEIRRGKNNVRKQAHVWCGLEWNSRGSQPGWLDPFEFSQDSAPMATW